LIEVRGLGLVVPRSLAGVAGLRPVLEPAGVLGGQMRWRRLVEVPSGVRVTPAGAARGGEVCRRRLGRVLIGEPWHQPGRVLAGITGQIHVTVPLAGLGRDRRRRWRSPPPARGLAAVAWPRPRCRLVPRVAGRGLVPVTGGWLGGVARPGRPGLVARRLRARLIAGRLRVGLLAGDLRAGLVAG